MKVSNCVQIKLIAMCETIQICANKMNPGLSEMLTTIYLQIIYISKQVLLKLIEHYLLFLILFFQVSLLFS